MTLKSNKSALTRLVVGARDQNPITDKTHNFYRYPARFSPTFAVSSIVPPGNGRL